MENKKSIIIASVAVILFVVVAFIFMYEPARNVFTKPSVIEQEKITGDLPVLECNSSSDKESYKDAITKKDVNLCNCINEEKLQNTCKTASMNTMFYNQALQQLDDSLCEKITSDIQKDACHTVVKSSVKQFANEDSEHLAKVYMTAHNQKAIGELEKLTKQDQENIGAYIALALVYAEKGLSEQEQGKDQTPYVNKAFEAVERAKQIDDKNSEVYRVEGYVNEIKPDFDQAQILYEKALDIDSNNMLAHAGMGHVYRMTGILKGAIEEFNKAATLDTERINVSIYTNLCNLEASRSHQEDAIKNCKIVLQMENADPIFQSEAYQIMAQIFMSNNDNVQAKSYLLHAKTLTPSDSNLFVVLSRFHNFEENYIESETNAKKAIDLSPTKTTGYLVLTQALYMQEKYSDSIQVAQKGLTLVKNDVSLLTPSKPAIERDLNYIISYNYRELGNTQKQQEYEKRGNDVSENNNLLIK